MESIKRIKLDSIKEIKSSKKGVSPIVLFYKEVKNRALKLIDHLYEEKDVHIFAIDVTKVYVSEDDYKTLQTNYKNWLKRVWKEPEKALAYSLGMAELQIFPCHVRKNDMKIEANEVILLEGWLTKRGTHE